MTKHLSSQSASKAQSAINLRSTDFVELVQLAVDKLSDPDLTPSMSHMLIGYFTRVAILEYQGRETTHANIMEKYNESLGTAVSALSRLVSLGLLEKILSPIGNNNGRRNMYRVPRNLIVEARASK
jgi:hypothetical protein